MQSTIHGYTQSQHSVLARMCFPTVQILLASTSFSEQTKKKLRIHKLSHVSTWSDELPNLSYKHIKSGTHSGAFIPREEMDRDACLHLMPGIDNHFHRLSVRHCAAFVPVKKFELSNICSSITCIPSTEDHRGQPSTLARHPLALCKHSHWSRSKFAELLCPEI